ncbi:hypothetical protein GCM10023091_42470 [Ravibacter arvi]|uniref:Glycosyltransferase RgtA/B/C/D-like domain-containing protein n=1 Tax=Ravibacter arvi TaxID=2051041 RepID=A0ABP8MAN0_9BACT
MGGNKLRSTFLYALFAALWLYVFFMSVVKPPFLSYYTFDETFVTDSGVFLWYGITPRILDWPASPSVLMYAGIFGLSLLYQVAAHLSELKGFLDAFVVMDRTAYDYLFDREAYILAGRAVQLLIVLTVMLWTIRWLMRKTNVLLTDQSRFWIILVLISTHLLWNNGVVLRPEAISAVFFLHILCRLVFSERLAWKDVWVLSLLFGIVVAERLIFMFMAPFFWCSIWLLSDTARWSRLQVSIGVFTVSFLAFCPFVLSDPLIVSKAFFGGIMAKVNDAPMETFFNRGFIASYFESPAGYLALLLTLLGITRLVKEKKAIYFVMIGNWLFFLFLVLKSSKIYDPHVLPGALINLLLIGLGLASVVEMAGRKYRYLGWAVAGLIVLGEVVAVVSYHSWVRRKTNVQAAVNWVIKELPADASILANIDVGLFIPPNNAALQRQISAADNIENRVRKLNYLMGLNTISQGGITAKEMPMAAAAFAFEDEELFGLQYRLLQKYGEDEKRKRFDIDLAVENNTLLYHGVPQAEADERFRNGHYTYLVTDDELEGLTPLKEFGGNDGAPLRVYKSVVKPSTGP